MFPRLRMHVAILKWTVSAVFNIALGLTIECYNYELMLFAYSILLGTVSPNGHPI